jgi:hypothetical protein
MSSDGMDRAGLITQIEPRLAEHGWQEDSRQVKTQENGFWKLILIGGFWPPTATPSRCLLPDIYDIQIWLD